MDSTNNKHKSRQNFSENSSSRDGTSSANQWQEDRRQNTKKRGRDGEWNRDRPFHGKNRDATRDEEAKLFRDEQAPAQTVQQPASFPAYNYNTGDHSYVDNNRRAISMMCYNGLPTMSVPMPINSNPSAVAPYAYMGMPADNMYGVFGMGNYCQYGMMSAAENMMLPPIKEVVQLTKTPPVVHYSEHEASLLLEKLRNEETFSEAALILITWLERGECSKRNVDMFYSMIQRTKNHVWRLQFDIAKYEEKLNDAKEMLKQNLEGVIRKIYKAVSLQKVWDHFTKAQRKNIEMWSKHTEELRNAYLEEVINEGEDEEIDLGEDISVDQIKVQSEEIHKLREEDDSLRCQIATLQNGITGMQFDHEGEIKEKDSQISALRQALENSKNELLNLQQKFSQEHAKVAIPECKECIALKCTVNNLTVDLKNSKEELASLNLQLIEGVVLNSRKW